jgi:predicted RNase H-like HicB family nuclease
MTIQNLVFGESYVNENSQNSGPESPIRTLSGEWSIKQNLLRCPVHLLPEEEGGYSVCSANLPGVASQGETEQEALGNITEALKGVIEVYKEQGSPIPWLKDIRGSEPKAIMRVIFINA